MKCARSSSREHSGCSRARSRWFAEFGQTARVQMDSGLLDCCSSAQLPSGSSRALNCFARPTSLRRRSLIAVQMASRLNFFRLAPSLPIFSFKNWFLALEQNSCPIGCDRPIACHSLPSFARTHAPRVFLECDAAKMRSRVSPNCEVSAPIA